jgi:hypothetical protein
MAISNSATGASRCLRGLLLCVGAALLPACLSAGGATGTLKPDDPALHGIADVAGQPVDVARVVANHEATVLFWWATRCPCVARYEARMASLRAAFPAERVAMLAVASNADDTRATISETARERGFALPILIDHGGRLARRLDVRTTPTTVVLDRQGNVRFLGWIDNERLPGENDREAYAHAAVAALLAGDNPTPARTPVHGCMITRSIGSHTHESARSPEEPPACAGN